MRWFICSRQDRCHAIVKLENIRFSHGFEMFNCWLRPEVDNNARREAEGINIDRGPQPMLNTENLLLNVIITHCKFISSPFTSLFLTVFQYFLNPSPSYIAMNTGKWATEMSMCSCLSSHLACFLKSIDKYVGFFAIYMLYLCTWRVKSRWTVRAKTLDRR